MSDSNSTLAYLADRLHEKSTYTMIPIILGLIGVNLDGDTIQMISTVGISLSGLALILMPEKGAQRTTTILAYLADRLKEPSTYVAIPVIAGIIGIHTTAGVWQTVSSIGVGVGGMLAGLLAEKGAGSTPPTPPAA